MLRSWIPGLLLFFLYGCGGAGSSSSTPGGSAQAGTVAPQGNAAAPAAPLAVDVQLRTALALGGVVPAPVAPPQESAKVALGEALMFDKILSGNKDIACASCHHPPQRICVTD